MDKEEIKNGRIESTSLGFEDHGIFTYSITIDYGGSGQGFGGYALGGEYTDKVIKGLIKAVGVENWEDLKGEYVRVKLVNRRITEIGHLLEDKWFNHKEIE